MGRIIGMAHRRKKTAEEKAQPTLIAIKEDGSNQQVVEYKLATETDELDFLLNRLPVGWREARSEDLSAVRSHHLKWKKVDGPIGQPLLRLQQGQKGQWQLVHQVPKHYVGIRPGDRVFSVLGGSGDAFCYATAKRDGVKVFRLPPANLKRRRGQAAGKQQDHKLLLQLAETEPELFYPVGERDMKLIELRTAYKTRMDAMKDRIACEQRLWQRTNNAIFLEGEANYPEGRVEDQYLARKANSTVLAALLTDEKRQEKELVKLVEGSEIYKQISPLVKGFGPIMAARIITAVGDIRRFPAPAKFRAYCGVHVLGVNGRKLTAKQKPPTKGVFPRRKRGELADWSGDARQGLYLLVNDQFGRQKDTYWGRKLRLVRAKLQAKHPEPELKLDEVGQPVMKDGQPVYNYTRGHLWSLAVQRTATIFATWLYWQWWRIEKDRPPELPRDHDEVMAWWEGSAS